MSTEIKINKSQKIKDLYFNENIKDNKEIYDRLTKEGIKIDKRFISNVMWAIRKPEDMLDRKSGISDIIRNMLNENNDLSNNELRSKLINDHNITDINRKLIVDTAWRIRKELKTKQLEQEKSNKDK